MKKKLESELISIAHRILKLKGKEDVIQLQQEAQKIYEKLSILRFYEENIGISKEEISEEALNIKLDQVKKELELPKVEAIKVEEEEKVEEVAETKNEINEEVKVEEEEKVEIQEEISSEEKKEEKSEPVFSPIFELTPEEEEEVAPIKENKQVSLEDFLTEDYKDLEFIKVEKVPEEVEKATEISFEKIEKTSVDEAKIEIVEKKTEFKISSLNDSLLKGINIGLNDRIAFVKHLFDGMDEDYNRVLSQLSTFNDFEEAENFIENMVKPDHNNWENKEEYAQRFISIIEKKFN